MAAKRTRLMFSYPGSKWRLAPKLVSLFPPHKIYLSPFLGTGAEFAFKKPSRREIANDIDDDIYSVFAVMRDRRLFSRLLRLLENSHDCRRLYEECFDRLRAGKLTTLERAYCFLMCGNLGFQGGHPLKGRSYGTGPAKKPRLPSLLSAVIAWRERMKHVEVENLDACDLLDRFDGPDVFAYCDPPYHPETCRQDLYAHNRLDHRRFVQRLQQFKGKVLVCGYEHGLYDVQLLGWRRQTFHVSKCYGGRAPRTEVVWMNYDATGNRLHHNSKLIQAFERLPA